MFTVSTAWDPEIHRQMKNDQTALICKLIHDSFCWLHMLQDRISGEAAKVNKFITIVGQCYLSPCYRMDIFMTLDKLENFEPFQGVHSLLLML